FGNYYLGRRALTVLRIAIPSLGGAWFWAAYITLASTFILPNLLPANAFTAYIRHVGDFWLGIFFYSFLMLLSVDVVRLAVSFVSKVLSREVAYGPAFQLALGAVVALSTLSLTAYGTVHAKRIKVHQYDVRIGKEAAGLTELRVALISDLHLGTQYGHDEVRKIRLLLDEAEPDILIMAGDIFDGNLNAVPHINKVMDEFLAMDYRYGIYAVLGNHDAGRTVGGIVGFLADAGVTLLQNEARVIDGAFVLAGMNDRSPIGGQGVGRTDIGRVLEGADRSMPILMIDHQPTKFAESSAAGVDLLLCGHTHKGQIFPISLITGAMYPSDYGYYASDGLQVVISSGIGTWGPPMRIGSDSEIAIIDVRFG
ncbi:MAG: metallophosphoesterase, partial [Oscillospiraceae bacterium]|nr:metallophosphoesterase [Oscillospiraceae bacterium]